VVEEDESDEVAYIGNRNSKKFHYPSCSSVDDMKESNKVEFYSRDEATSAGYDPCGRCHP
jgi:methylphosphotriester-DNA--protein-cysteine methyltransferase